jgi:hypothetical protein
MREKDRGDRPRSLRKLAHASMIGDAPEPHGSFNAGGTLAFDLLRRDIPWIARPVPSG